MAGYAFLDSFRDYKKQHLKIHFIWQIDAILYLLSNNNLYICYSLCDRNNLVTFIILLNVVITKKQFFSIYFIVFKMATV